MNNLFARIKTYDYKAFFLRHGEKVGMGAAVAIVLLVLAITNWSGYAGTPEGMSTDAEKMDSTLRSNVFPKEKAAEFSLLKAETQTNRAIGAVDARRYEHSVPMSPRLFSLRLPAEEPEVLSPIELHARSGVFALAKYPPESQYPTTGMQPGFEADGRPQRGRRAQPVDPAMAERMISLQPGDTFDQGMMPMVAYESRMRRFNVVVGKIDRHSQLNKLKQKLHLDSAAEAAYYLEYVNFRVQRQRAVPGPNPWPDDDASWKELDVESSIDLLFEAADFDPELVPIEYTNEVVTSPLPHRLDGTWMFASVGHPGFPEMAELEMLIDQAATITASVLAEESASQQSRRRGFARVQNNGLQMRADALKAAGAEGYQSTMNQFLSATGKTNPRLKELLQRFTNRTGMGGRAGTQPTRAPARGPGMAANAGIMGSELMMEDPLGMGMGGGGFGFGAPASMMAMGNPSGVGALTMEADSILFRYFDFDVEPGECYRYRIKLIITNPNYEQTYVVHDDVASGETRESQNWSPPSTAAAVPRDVEYALVRVVPKRTDLDVVQNDPEAATIVAETLPLAPGKYIGGGKETQRLVPTRMTNKKEWVAFSSRDVLADSASLPPLSSSLQDDLKLDAKKLKDMQAKGEFDQALAVTRFGEVVALDAGSKSDLRAAKARYETQNKEFDELLKVANLPNDPNNPYAGRGMGNLRGSQMYSQMLADSGMDPAMLEGMGSFSPLKGNNKKLRNQLRNQLNKGTRGGVR